MALKTKNIFGGFRSTHWHVLIVAVALLVIGAFFWKHDKTNSVSTAQPTATNNATQINQEPTVKTPTSNNGTTNNGGASDTSGSNVASTSPGQWITSQSGSVTVEQPIPNSKLQSGYALVGSAKQLTQVSWRLNDNEAGVIAQGVLGVDNGKFSGILHFTPRGNSGRLDVFSVNSRGVENNEIQIDVSF